MGEGLEGKQRRIENRPEISPSIRIPGQTTLKNVKKLDDALEIISDLMKEGILTIDNFVVGSGFAVEIITGIKRIHKDLDLIAFDDSIIFSLLGEGIDVVAPEQTWVEMNIDEELLKRTKMMISLNFQGREIQVMHPVILLVQKCADWGAREPRDKDNADAEALIGWITAQDNSDKKGYDTILDIALKSLPSKQVDLTKLRIDKLLDEIAESTIGE